jgi:hypothetical protein
MSESKLNREISNRIRSFTDELSTLIKQAALESVTKALGASAAHESVEEAAPRSKRPGRRKTRRVGRPATQKEVKKTPGGSKGSKRSPRQLETLTNNLLGEIKAKPGQGIEQIAKRLGIRSKNLALPIKKLLARNILTKKGERRSTTYFAS